MSRTKSPKTSILLIDGSASMQNKYDKIAETVSKNVNATDISFVSLSGVKDKTDYHDGAAGEKTAVAVVQKLKNFNNPNIVFLTDEPFDSKILVPFTDTLKKLGYHVHVVSMRSAHTDLKPLSAIESSIKDLFSKPVKKTKPDPRPQSVIEADAILTQQLEKLERSQQLKESSIEHGLERIEEMKKYIRNTRKSLRSIKSEYSKVAAARDALRTAKPPRKKRKAPSRKK